MPMLWVPIIHPCWSRGMSVLVDGAAESVPSADVEVRDPLRIGNRFGKRAQRCGSSESPVGPVLVVEVLELPEGVREVALVPDERAVPDQEPRPAPASSRSMTRFLTAWATQDPTG